MKKYIEIDGKKYKIDPKDNTKALLDDKGKKVPYVEKKEEPKVDASKMSLDELAKVNPAIKKLSSTLDDLTTKLKKIEDGKDDDERKKKEEEGKWQDIANEETKKRKEAEGEATKNTEILNKYKSTTNKMLEKALGNIAEDKQALIPSDYSARKKLEYITENAKVLGVTAKDDKGNPIPPNDKDIDHSKLGEVTKAYDELLANKERTPIENQKVVELSREIKTLREGEGEGGNQT